jgi:hypothetical protein
MLALAAKEFVKPGAKHAKAYPAHDEHTNEAVTVAVDPYDFADKEAQVFSVRWTDEGYLPVFVVITNDGDLPISLTAMEAQFVTAHRDKISPATNDDLYRRLSHLSGGGASPLPLPIPRKPKGAVSKKAQEEIDAAQFNAKAVEPHSSQSGFLFFDVSGISTPLPGARFFLTGVRDSKGTELLYFEVPLEKYLTAPARMN